VNLVFAENIYETHYNCHQDIDSHQSQDFFVTEREKKGEYLEEISRENDSWQIKP
jgi:hypothetical protein